MAVIPPANRQKLIEYAAPHTSTDFKDFNQKVQGGGSIISGLEVTSDGVNATIQPGIFAHLGVLCETHTAQDVPLPGSYPATLRGNTVDHDLVSDVVFEFGVTGAPIAVFLSATQFITGKYASLDALDGMARIIPNRPDYLINGGFEVDQRATPAAHSAPPPKKGPFGPDAWQTYISPDATTGTVTLDQIQLTAHREVGNSSARMVITMGTSTSVGMCQTVLNVSQLRGKTITFTARVKTDVASTVKLRMDSVGAVFSGYHSGSGEFETLTVSQLIPPAATLIGFFVESDTSDCTVYVDSTSAVIGDYPEGVTYIPQSLEVQLADSATVYEKGHLDAYVVGGDDGSDYHIRQYIQFKERKQALPTVTLSNVVMHDEGDDVTDTSGSYTISVDDLSLDGFTFHATKSNNGGDDPRPNAIICDWEAEV
jgi:hypothetical protein